MINWRKTVDIPFPQFLLKILKKHLLEAWFTWLAYISLYFLPYLIFAKISSTCNSPRFNLSVINIFNPTVSIKFGKNIQHSIWEQKCPLHYVDLYLETLKVCSELASNPAGYFHRKTFPQPQECGARLITVRNQPVPRPSTIFFACSQANHFFFSTSWKYWRFLARLKTLKYRYRKGLDVVPTRKIRMSQIHKIKAFDSIMW